MCLIGAVTQTPAIFEDVVASQDRFESRWGLRPVPEVPRGLPRDRPCHAVCHAEIDGLRRGVTG